MPDATVTYNLADALGADYDPSRTKLWVEFNTANNRVTDAEGKIRIGAGESRPNADGTGAITGIPIPSASTNPIDFQIKIHYDAPPKAFTQRNVKRDVGDFGWMTVTASGSLDDLEAEQFVPPTYLSQVTAQLDALVDQAEAAAAQAVDVSEIAVSDDVVEALVKGTAGAGPKTRDALAATVAVAVQIVTSKIKADGTDQTATLQAEITALGSNGGVILIPAGTYVFTGTIALPARVRLAGITRAGASTVSNGGGTVLSHEPTTAIGFIDTPAGTTYCQNIGLSNLIIKGNANSTFGLNLNNPQHSAFVELRVSGFDKNIVVSQAILTTFADIRSTGARTSCLHVTGLVSTTVTFRRCYWGQTTGVAASRPIIIDKGAALGITFADGGAESTELGVVIGAGNKVDFDHFYTENIPATAAPVAVFEIGKTGAPTVAADGTAVTFAGCTLAGTNSGVFTGTSMFDVDYCHNLIVTGGKIKRVRDVVLNTANAKKAHFAGVAQVQVTNAISSSSWPTRVSCTYGGVNETDSFPRTLTMTAVVDFGSMAAGAQTFATVAFAGSVTNDVVLIGYPAAPEGGLHVTGRVSAAGTVNLRAFNQSAATLDPASATYRLTILRDPSQ